MATAAAAFFAGYIAEDVNNKNSANGAILCNKINELKDPAMREFLRDILIAEIARTDQQERAPAYILWIYANKDIDERMKKDIRSVLFSGSADGSSAGSGSGTSPSLHSSPSTPHGPGSP